MTYFDTMRNMTSDPILRQAIDAAERRAVPPPDLVCSWCGQTEARNRERGYGPLVPFTVEVARSEEGWAQVSRLACDEHLTTASEALIAAGFASHAHGDINFLEDESCPGSLDAAKCPTPDLSE